MASAASKSGASRSGPSRAIASRAPTSLARLELRDRHVEADRDEVRRRDEHAHVARRPLPALARPVDVPAPVHAHVRAQHEVAGEAHQQMLAAGLDRFDGAAGDRRVVVDARERRVDGLEARHDLPGERAMQRARGAEDRVAFRHGAPRDRRARPSRPRVGPRRVRPALAPHLVAEAGADEAGVDEERRERMLVRGHGVDLADEQPAVASLAAAGDRRPASPTGRGQRGSARARPPAATSRSWRPPRGDVRDAGAVDEHDARADGPRRAAAHRRAAAVVVARRRRGVRLARRPLQQRAVRIGRIGGGEEHRLGLVGRLAQRAQQIERRRQRELRRADAADEVAAPDAAALLERLEHVVDGGEAAGDRLGRRRPRA